MSSSFTGPCHVLQRTSKFTRKLDKSCVDDEVYPPGEITDRTSSLRDFYEPFEARNPGIMSLGDCGSLSNYLETRKMIAEKYLARHFLSIKQAAEEGDLENAY